MNLPLLINHQQQVQLLGKEGNIAVVVDDDRFTAIYRSKEGTGLPRERRLHL
jgi:uncharacterized linocin/CFP29 family protein